MTPSTISASWMDTRNISSCIIIRPWDQIRTFMRPRTFLENTIINLRRTDSCDETLCVTEEHLVDDRFAGSFDLLQAQGDAGFAATECGAGHGSGGGNRPLRGN